jgi:hypothetical protein
MKQLKEEVGPYLQKAMVIFDLVHDWAIVETIHNKEATYVSQKAIERALNYKVPEEPKEPEANAGEASGS